MKTENILIPVGTCERIIRDNTDYRVSADAATDKLTSKEHSLCHAIEEFNKV